jgi:hypothetical protein
MIVFAVNHAGSVMINLCINISKFQKPVLASDEEGPGRILDI